jgi:hypothetical protein
MSSSPRFQRACGGNLAEALQNRFGDAGAAGAEERIGADRHLGGTLVVTGKAR